MKLIKFSVFLIAATLLASCSTSTPRDNEGRYRISNDRLPSDYKNFDASKIPNAVPKVEPRSRYGNASSYVVLGKRYYVLKSAAGYHERGIASYYGVKFHNFRTSSGELYNMYGMSAANKVLPLPTYVRVTNLVNHRSVIVKVNDRGPFHENRIIDLSFAAAKKLDMIRTGTALVEVVALDPHNPAKTTTASAPVSKYSSKPSIYLQMGAFSKHNSAENFEDRLHQYTKRQIRIVTGSNQNGTIYRVQIGPLANVAEADELTAALKKHGLGNAFAVVE